MAHVTDIVESAIRRFDEEQDPAGHHRLFEIARVSDVFRSHDAARACLGKLGGDAVLWGDIEDNPSVGAPASVETHVSVGSIAAGDNATIKVGNIDFGAKPFTLTPSITLKRKERWILSSSRLDLSSLADIDFKTVASDRSLFFVPFLAGAIAFEHGDTDRALKMLRLASDGSLHATGDARLYAAMYLGALNLFLGDGSAAAKDLDVAPEVLTGAPSSLAWQNRILYALANEEAGSLLKARRGYEDAEALVREGDARRYTTAFAKTGLLIHLGDAETALRELDSLKGSIKPCVRLSDPVCLQSELFRLRGLAIKVVALEMLGQTEEVDRCIEITESEKRKLLSERSLRGALVPQFGPEGVGAVATDRPPEVALLSMGQDRGCASVHFGMLTGRVGRKLLASAQKGAAHEMWIDAKRDSEAMLTRSAPGLRRVFEQDGACLFSLAAASVGLYEDAQSIARDAAAALDPTDSPLARAEIGLLNARVEMGLGHVKEAEAKIREAVPLLREAMGPDAPAVKAWEQALITHSVPKLVAKKVPHIECGKDDL